MRRLVFLSVFLTLVAGFLSLATAAAAQAGSFTIAQNGKAVGTASFNFASTPHGYSSTAVVRIAMQGLNYSLSKTESLSAANHLRHVQVSAILNNAAVNVTAAPDAAQFLLNVSASGRSTTARLESHPATVFISDFDPGALETLLALGVAQNNSNLWAIIPKQATGQDGTVQAGSVQPVQLATYADEQGTLDTKPITVHHLVATIAGAKTDIFSGPDNQLLQAELPQQGFDLVRDGFVLTPPAKPGAPPVQTPPAAAPQAPTQQ
jgi:hypothetical protein